MFDFLLGYKVRKDGGLPLFLLIPRELSGKSNTGYEHGHGFHVHEWLLDSEG